MFDEMKPKSALKPAAKDGANLLHVQVICPCAVTCLGAQSLLLKISGLHVSVCFPKTSQTDYFSLVDPEAQLLILIVSPGAVLPGDVDRILACKSRFHLLVLEGDQRPSEKLAGYPNAAFISFSSGLECWRKAFTDALRQSCRVLQNSAISNRSHSGFSGKHLTPRQIQVLTAISKGYTNDQIAAQMGISPGTIKSHVSSIFRILRASNRLEALLRYKELLVSQGRKTATPLGLLE